MKIFSIRDEKAGAYNLPFFSPTGGTASREVASGLMADKKMTSFAVDFTLYEIGTFDPTTGRIEALESPHHIIDIIELVNPDVLIEEQPSLSIMGKQ